MQLFTLQILTISTSLLAWITISSSCFIQLQYYKKKLIDSTYILPLLLILWIITTYTLYESFFLCQNLPLKSSFSYWALTPLIPLIYLYYKSQITGFLSERKRWFQHLLLPGTLAVIYIGISLISPVGSLITSYVFNILFHLATISLGGYIIWNKKISQIIMRELKSIFPRITTISVSRSTCSKKVPQLNEKQKDAVFVWLHEPEMFKSKINLKIIAKDILINPATLSKFIKEEIGGSLANYIVSLRLDNFEKSLLDKKQDKSVTEIAEETGFQSIASFYRAFIKRHQISPLKWKEHKLNETKQSSNS